MLSVLSLDIPGGEWAGQKTRRSGFVKLYENQTEVTASTWRRNISNI